VRQCGGSPVLLTAVRQESFKTVTGLPSPELDISDGREFLFEKRRDSYPPKWLTVSFHSRPMMCTTKIKLQSDTDELEERFPENKMSIRSTPGRGIDFPTQQYQRAESNQPGHGFSIPT
jgi:hypothetical protein